MIRKILASLVLVTVVAVGVAYAVRHNSVGANGDGKLRVAASYYPLYDFARNVGGDKVAVTNMTPAGAEPHDYEPSAKVLVDAAKASVFVYNGGRLEPWVTGFLQGYTHTAVKASSGIDLLTAQDEGGSTRSSTSAKVQDPHFWLDPVLAQQIVNNIRDGLVRADPANADYYARNAAEYNQQLAALDTAYRSGLAGCAQRTVISSHDAFSYLGKRYNVHIVSIAGLSPDEEPSAAKLAEISQQVTTQGIHYIFFESLVSPRLAQTIAQETGAQTLVFDPIEGLSDADQKQSKNYLSVQRENLRALRTALSCS